MTKILIIDDEPADCTFITQLLAGSPYELHSIHHLSEAVETIARFQPDIILVDFLIGGDTGLDFIIQFTKKGRLDHNLVLMTAYGSAELKEDALVLGASYFLDKDKLTREGLIEMVEKLTQGSTDESHTKRENVS